MTAFPDAPDDPPNPPAIEIVRVSTPKVDAPTREAPTQPLGPPLPPGELSEDLKTLLKLVKQKEMAIAPLRKIVSEAKAALGKHTDECALLEREIESLRERAHQQFRDEMLQSGERVDLRGNR